MTETAVETPAVTSKKGVKGKATKKAAAKTGKPNVPSHPPTSQMVDSAIKNLNEKGGSSLRAVRKYIAAQYKVDTSKSTHIKKYLKSAVASGKLVQTKGTGATGSFKFPAKDKPTKKPSTKPKKTAKSPAKKSAVKPKAVAKKTKVATKSPAKPKPKPKKLKVTTAKPAKKTTSPKRKAPKRK
ncbi:histone H1C-like [Cimex lectularius]|uniref:H15 domain-containing protein n=1 Tax=Cimex lectularius TaxID=79782 RepID=A0A8I6S4L5_CIMLE|nr:histone H1C-like [Cimex lectularius]